MEASTDIRTCGNLECKIALDGVCLEGFQVLSDCPHFGKQPPADDRDAPRSPTMVGVALASGKPLNIREAESYLRQFPSRLVAFVGAAESGKTSLFSSLYDCFQEGKMARHAFARSATLAGLEKVCHHARSVSGRNTPHSPRTKRGPVLFYHLELQDLEGCSSTLLLADRAGEHYLDATSDSAVVAEFVEITRADCICALVDGARLLDPLTRHQVRTELLLTFRAFEEGGRFSGGQRLFLVLTKDDLLEDNVECARAEWQFESLVNAMRATFGTKFAEIQAHRVCAQPKEKPALRARGIANLLAEWMKEGSHPAQKSHTPIGARQFARIRPLGVNA